jgi:uncharacterized protein (TIGR03118 family)
VESLEERRLPSGGYVQTNLVSDIPGVARVTDPNLVNPWGLSEGPRGPFWVSDNATGVSTLYDGQGQPQSAGLGPAIGIPSPAGTAGALGTPTGTVFNPGTGFVIESSGRSGPSLFLFATEDGQLAGWNPAVDLAQAIVAVDHSGAGAVYKGLAIGTDSHGRRLLYATNFAAGTIRIFDQDFQAVGLSGSFTDPALPAGFAPFGIENIGGLLFVTYAKQNSERYDDVAGPGNGFVDVFDGDGHLLHRLVSAGPLDSPWGLALAPAGFGVFSHDLLVGNAGDGHINAFDPQTGQVLGQLKDSSGRPLVIGRLWALEFGNGAGDRHGLFFSAGIDEEHHGLFGELQSSSAVADRSNSGHAPGGTIYAAKGVSSSERDGTPGTVDNYPLPPATGPVPRGDGALPPPPLTLLLPLRDVPRETGPLLVTRMGTGAADLATAAPPPSAVVGVSETGSGAGVTPNPIGPAVNVGAVSSGTSPDHGNTGDLTRPLALDVLLTLRSQPDTIGQRLPASQSSFASEKPLADTVADQANRADIARLPPGSERRLRDEWLPVVGNPAAPSLNAEEDSTPIKYRRDVAPGPEGSLVKPQGLGVPLASLEPRKTRREKTRGASYYVATLLAAGGVCLSWVIGPKAGGVTRKGVWPFSSDDS